MNLSKIIQLLRMNSILDVEREEGSFPRLIGILRPGVQTQFGWAPLSPKVSGSGRKPGHQEAFLPQTWGSMPTEAVEKAGRVLYVQHPHPGPKGLNLGLTTWLLLSTYSMSLVSLGVKQEMAEELSSRWGRGEGSWKAGQALLPIGCC